MCAALLLLLALLSGTPQGVRDAGEHPEEGAAEEELADPYATPQPFGRANYRPTLPAAWVSRLSKPELLGKGTTAVVAKSTVTCAEVTCAEVAVKEMLEDADYHPRMDLEVAALTAFDSPNIIAHLAHGVRNYSDPDLGDRSYIMMELARGGSLQGLLEDDNEDTSVALSFYDSDDDEEEEEDEEFTNLKAKQAAMIPEEHVKLVGILLVGMLRGMKAMHEKSVLHCDLKPDNILIFEEAPPTEIKSNITTYLDQIISETGHITTKLTDLGSACELGSEDETPTINIPRCEWRCHGNAIYGGLETPVGLYSDMWSLGVILYELSFHKLPEGLRLERLPDWDSVDPSERKKNYTNNFTIAEDEYKRLGESPLKDLLKKLLQSDPKKRATAVEALEIAEEWAEEAEFANQVGNRVSKLPADCFHDRQL